MVQRTARGLNDAKGAHPAHRPGSSPALSRTYAPTMATGSFATRPHATPPSCPCCEASESSHTVTDIDPNGDEGRRLRRITATWFSACIFALFLLWHGVADEAQWSELPSESGHDRGAPVTLLGNETG